MAGPIKGLRKERITRAQDLYLSAKSPREIEKALKLEYGVSGRTAQEDIRRAKERLAVACSDEQKEALLELSKSILRRATEMAERLDKPEAMINGAKTLAEITGAYTRKFEGQVQITGLADIFNEDSIAADKEPKRKG